MDEQRRAALEEEIANMNDVFRGERFYALAELGPGRWFVRSLDVHGERDDQPAEAFWNELYHGNEQAEDPGGIADPDEAEAEAVDEADEIRDIELDEAWEQRNRDDDPKFDSRPPAPKFGIS